MGTLQFILTTPSVVKVGPEKSASRRALDQARFVNTPARLVSAYKSLNVLNRVITDGIFVRIL